MSSSSHDVHSAESQTAAVQRRATFEVSETPPSRSGPRRASTGALALARINSRISIAGLRRAITVQMTPEKPLKEPPTLWHGIKAIIMMSWLNILLCCIPVSWALNFALPKTSSNDTLIFIFSFLSIIPLAKLLAFSTDELSMRVGQTLAGLLNATLGNAVELIVSIIALIKCELQIVQSSRTLAFLGVHLSPIIRDLLVADVMCLTAVVGSILSNLLLVLGMCFFAGGVRYSEQGFVMSATQLNSSLLTVSVIAVLLPAAFHLSAGSEIPDPQEGKDILSFSRGASIILLFIYGSYLVFQLFSHKELYNEDIDTFKSTRYPQRPHGESRGKWLARLTPSSEPLSPQPMEGTNGVISTTTTMNQDGDAEAAQKHEPEEEEAETPQMSVPLTIGLLVTVTLVAVTAEWLVDSINGLTESGKISKEFVGLILLPIVGNAAEHVTAVTVSVKDKLTLSLGVAVGSSIQIALFVIPFSVVLSWILGKPLTLLFDPFESITLFLSVLVVNYTVQDGKSNWLEGMILMCLYVIIALTFWYYPGVNISQQLASC
ncbi:Calcium/proton exchanger [Amylocystis lapponica]|nr:Calcium/proton exchanger [Amylocystis lapponica]